MHGLLMNYQGYVHASGAICCWMYVLSNVGMMALAPTELCTVVVSLPEIARVRVPGGPVGAEKQGRRFGVCLSGDCMGSSEQCKG